MTQLQTLLTQHFPDIAWEFDKPLANLTYFRLGGPAEVFWPAASVPKLQEVLAFCQGHQVKVTIMGGASNVIVSDEGIKGLVIQLQLRQVTPGQQTAAGLTTLNVEAGCKTSLLVGQTVQLGLTGLEYFLGVPGTVGGAIFNNAHYLSHLIGEHVTKVSVLNQNGQLSELTATQAEFGYDSSRFQQSHEVIVAVEFALAKGTMDQSQALIKEATEYRAATQPLGEPSSGCIFQNVPNTPELRARFPQFAERSHVPGGFLIDQAGLKGHRHGDIEVSHKHAAFFVNKGHGTAKDVLDLIHLVKDQVKNQFQVELREEVFVLA